MKSAILRGERVVRVRMSKALNGSSSSSCGIMKIIIKVVIELLLDEVLVITDE